MATSRLTNVEREALGHVSVRPLGRNDHAQTGAELVRIIGNVAILYKESSDPDKRKHLI